jgi:hypothetical protein
MTYQNEVRLIIQLFNAMFINKDLKVHGEKYRHFKRTIDYF